MAIEFMDVSDHDLICIQRQIWLLENSCDVEP